MLASPKAESRFGSTAGSMRVSEIVGSIFFAGAGLLAGFGAIFTCGFVAGTGLGAGF